MRLALDGVLKGRVGDKGIDEGALEGRGHFTQFGQGDTSGHFGPFQLAHGGRGHRESMCQSSLTHTEGVTDGLDPTGMWSGPHWPKIRRPEFAVEFPARLG
jgi:hypothetical protein